MDTPITQDPTDPVAHYLKTYGAAQTPAAAPDPDPVAHYLNTYKPAAPEQPGAISRAWDKGKRAVSQAAAHPLDTAASLIAAPVKSAFDAAVAPGVGEARPDARLSKGGNSSGRAIDTTAYDAQHGGITTGERTAAGLQTVANIAAPGVMGKVADFASPFVGKAVGKAAGLATAGFGAGAAYDPSDPLAGGLAGAALANMLHGTGKAIGGTMDSAASAASHVIDIAGRPATSQTLMSIAGRPLVQIQSAGERAGTLNQRALGQSLPFVMPDGATSSKPLTPVEIIGQSAQRLARGLKTSSPGAETVLRTALEGRNEHAVDRVIQHGLETTGLVNRESGILTENDLKNQAAQQGKEAYTKTFAGSPDPIGDPAHLKEINEILATDAGKVALKRGMRIANNFRDPIGSVAEKMSAPEGVDPSDWANMQRLAAERGMPIPDNPNGARLLAPTLKQMHYIKLGFDDSLNGAPEPGSGGSGPVEAASTRQLKNDWLAVMDEHAPDYKATRGQYADTKQLERAANLGQQLFKMDPDQMKLEMADLPAAAQQMVRRTGFNALAERVENGPADVERSLAKPRDMKRTRLLFPDDASFKAFQDGLSQEAQMHASSQGILGGSNTADKLADIANMSGVTLPDMVRTLATGRWHTLAGRAAANVVRRGMNASSDALASERARLLVAGADGNIGSRADALSQMGFKLPEPPTPAAPPQPVPSTHWLPSAAAGAFDDQHAQAMPIPQQVPRSHWLNPGPTFSGVAGDVSHGAAMPMQQPLPLNRRLMSGGPAAVPTAGQFQMGPGMPARGLLLDMAVQQEIERLYRSRPQLAVSMTREQQAQLAEQVRQRFLNPRDPYNSPIGGQRQ